MSSSRILVLGKIKSVRGAAGGLRIIKKGGLLDRLQVPFEINFYTAAGLRDGFLMEPVPAGKFRVTGYEPLGEEAAEIILENRANGRDPWSLIGLFVGMELEAARAKFHDPEDPYLFEYLDCEVYEGPALRGRIDRVEDYNGRQWLIVVDNEKNETMLPLQGNFISSFDYKSGRLYVAEGSGLFDQTESHDEA